MMRRVLFGVVAALVIGGCAPEPVAVAHKVCALHERALVVRVAPIDRTIYSGFPIEGSAAAQASKFPRPFVRPGYGEIGETPNVLHCVECTLAEITWLEEHLSEPSAPFAWVPTHEGATDVSVTVPAVPEALSAAVMKVMEARGVAVHRHTFEGLAGYLRADAPTGFVEVWWDAWVTTAGNSEIELRFTPSDKRAARRLLLDVMEAANTLR